MDWRKNSHQAVFIQGLITNYVNECYNSNLIIDCMMDKEMGRTFYNSIRQRDNIPYKYRSFQWWMKKFNVVEKNSYNPNILRYRPQALSRIVDNQVMYNQTTVLVDQSIAFRGRKLKCPTCNKAFKTEKDRHAHATAKKHFFEKPGTESLIIEHELNKGNTKEHIQINKKNCNTSVLLHFCNTSNQDLEITEIIQENHRIVMFVAINDEPFTLHANTRVEIHLRLNFSEYRSFDYPLLITYKQGDQPARQLIKHLVIQNHHPDYNHLHAAAPYVPRKPVIKDINERTEYKTRKKVVGGKFNHVRKLQEFKLPDPITMILNCGFKEGEKLPAGCRTLLKSVKKLMQVTDPLNCLNLDNYYEMLRLLLNIEEHQLQKDIRNYDMDTNALTHIGQHLYKLSVPGLAESRPSLLNGDKLFLKIADTKYEAHVCQVGLDHVILDTTSNFSRHFKAGMTVNVRFTVNRYPLQTQYQALHVVSSLQLQSLLFPKNVGDAEVIKITGWVNKNIRDNQQQQQAVRHIVSKTSLPAPYLIFGPPGTGKTTTLVEAIQQIRQYKPTDKILVCAPSNNSANIITQRLSNITNQEMLRFVAQSYSVLELETCNIKKYANFKQGQYHFCTLAELMRYRIIVTTIVNAARLYNLGIPESHFSYVFIDEAGHATETETIIPLAGIAYGAHKSAGKVQVVLAGDPKQLGPIIHSKLALNYGFARSMLERFMDTLTLYQKQDGAYNSKAVTKLLKNYRSHPAILEIPNNIFYESELIASAGQDSKIAIGCKLLKNTKFPVIFHGAFGFDEREASSPSFFNVVEIQFVCEYLKQLIGTKLNGTLIRETDIAVISPYTKQVKKISTMCQKFKWPNVAIGTVEKFQGDEKKIVIISTVRSTPEYAESHDFKYHLGFLKNPKRFNVAITRAKALLIVIGNPALLQYDENWLAFMKYCKENSSFLPDNYDLPHEKPLLPNEADQLIPAFENFSINDEFGRNNE